MLNSHYAFPASNKERRLCAQVLAGCVFSELLPANPALMKGFLLHLGRAYEITCGHFGRPTETLVPIILHSLHRDLDCDALSTVLAEHTYQAGETVGFAGSADLRIIGRQAMVSLDFECWLREAAVPADGHHAEPGQQPTTDLLRVLVVTRRSWAKAQTDADENMRNAGKGLFLPSGPFAVVFWEDILALVSRFAGPRPLISYLFGLLDF